MHRWKADEIIFLIIYKMLVFFFVKKIHTIHRWKADEIIFLMMYISLLVRM